MGIFVCQKATIIRNNCGFLTQKNSRFPSPLLNHVSNCPTSKCLMNLYESIDASTKLSDKSGELNNASHSSTDDTLSPLPSATWYNSPQKKKSIEKNELLMSWNGFLGISQFTWNIFFVFLVVFGQVGQNVSLPIWFASSPTLLDPLFVLTFAGCSFIFIFGCFTFIDICNGKTSVSECRMFTSKSFIFRYCSIGICNAFNGILLVFAASPKRTPPYLQSILGTFNIAWTMIFRFMILRKKPSVIQFIYAVGVFVGLFVASAPVIFNMNDKSSFHSEATGVWKWLWPLIFGVSFAPAAVMNVVAEHVLKDSTSTKSEPLMVLRLNDDSDDGSSTFVPAKNVNVWYYLTMQSIVQELTFIAFFWVDGIPTFGNASNVSDIFSNIKQDWRYFFGLDGATVVTSVRALVFIGCYALNYIGSSLMLRYTEGATLTAIVGALVTPLGAVFWMLFCLCGIDQKDFRLEGTWESSDWLVISGLVIMSVFIFLYDYFSHKAAADCGLATEIEKTKISNIRGYAYRIS